MSSYLALKTGYINKTHTHTHIQKVELKTLYFNFDPKAFSPFDLEETTNYPSLSAWELMVLRAVSHVIMRVHTPKVELDLAAEPPRAGEKYRLPAENHDFSNAAHFYRLN